jgi:hypothetical protein
MCDREMDKAAAWVGGLPIGPKCLQKMGDKPTKVRGQVVRNDQPELFDAVAKDEASE